MSIYRDVIDNCCVKMEETLGLLQSIKGKQLKDKSPKEIFTVVNKSYKSSSHSDRDSLRVSMFDQVSLLSHVKERIDFADTLEIDYADFPEKDRILETTSIFFKKSNLSKSNLNKVNKLLATLTYIDRAKLELRFTLQFRLLVVFLALASMSFYEEAKVVGSLIYHQVERSK